MMTMYIGALGPKAVKAIEEFDLIKNYAFNTFFVLVSFYALIHLVEAGWNLSKGDMAEGLLNVIPPFIMMLTPGIFLFAYKMFKVL